MTINPFHPIQSYTPYRTQQRPIVTSVNMAEYIKVGADLWWDSWVLWILKDSVSFPLFLTERF